MKESLRFRLDQMSDRFEEVTAMLSEPETMNDNKKFRELSVEHSDLSALVDVWGKYRQAEEDLATAEEMLSDSTGDGDMKEMAQEEIQAAKDTINELEDVLNVMMLPKDPNDKVPAFLEIRAGTGGDEAAICSVCMSVMRQPKVGQWKYCLRTKVSMAAIKKSSAVYRARVCMVA